MAGCSGLMRSWSLRGVGVGKMPAKALGAFPLLQHEGKGGDQMVSSQTPFPATLPTPRLQLEQKLVFSPEPPRTAAKASAKTEATSSQTAVAPEAMAYKGLASSLPGECEQAARAPGGLLGVGGLHFGPWTQLCQRKAVDTLRSQAEAWPADPHEHRGHRFGRLGGQDPWLSGGSLCFTPENQRTSNGSSRDGEK